jgi:hypothetical protein
VLHQGWRSYKSLSCRFQALVQKLVFYLLTSICCLFTIGFCKHTKSQKHSSQRVFLAFSLFPGKPAFQFFNKKKTETNRKQPGEAWHDISWCDTTLDTAQCGFLEGLTYA